MFIDTLILCTVNIILGYLLVFGKMGFPEMGIAGAGLASGISEITAFVIFVIYMIFDKEIRKFDLLKIPHFEFAWIKTINSISFTILLQSMLAIDPGFYSFLLSKNWESGHWPFPTCFASLISFLLFPAGVIRQVSILW